MDFFITNIDNMLMTFENEKNKQRCIYHLGTDDLIFMGDTVLFPGLIKDIFSQVLAQAACGCIWQNDKYKSCFQI